MIYFDLLIFAILLSLPLVMLTLHHAASTIFFLLLIATLVSIPFQKKINWNDSPFPWWLFASILFYPLVVIIHSTISGILDKHSLEIASRFLVMPLFLIYRPMIKPGWQRWLYIASAVGAILSLISGAYFINFDFNLRMRSYFTGVTNFGNLASLLGVLSMGLLYQQKNKILYLLGLLGALAAASSSFFSQTRTSWVAILIIFVILLFNVSNVKKISKITIALIVGVSLTLLYCDNPIVRERVQLAKKEILEPSKDNPTSSLGIRKELIKSAWLIIKERPLAGVGAGQFPKTLLAHKERGEVQYNLEEGLSHPHNEILFSWVEFGILGALSMLALYLGPALFFYNYLEKNELSVRIAARLGLLIIISYMIFGVPDVMITAWIMESSIFVEMLLIPLFIIGSYKNK